LVALFASGIGTIDTGAALTVIHRGRTVVDVWAGHRDQARASTWTRETVAPAMSVGKAMLAVALLNLAEQGRLDLDAPVADVWPAFGADGKQSITASHILTHTAGLPFHEAVPAGADWTRHEVLAASLERQEPRWAPGSIPAYHSLTMGTLVDGIVRRITGQPVAAWLASEIVEAHQLEARLGLAHGSASIAEVGPSPQAEAPLGDTCVADPECHPVPGEPTRTYELVNSARFRESEWPSINCFTTARGIAAFYSVLLDDSGVLS